MNDLARKLTDAFKQLQLRFEILPTDPGLEIPPPLFGRLEGELLGVDTSVFVKASDRIANVSLIPALFPGNRSESDQFDLAVNLLKLNCEFPFGRVGLLRHPSSDVLVIVCETMFWIPTETSPDFLNEIRMRLDALRTLEGAVTAQVQIL